MHTTHIRAASPFLKLKSCWAVCYCMSEQWTLTDTFMTELKWCIFISMQPPQGCYVPIAAVAQMDFVWHAIKCCIKSFYSLFAIHKYNNIVEDKEGETYTRNFANFSNRIIGYVQFGGVQYCVLQPIVSVLH